jgi:DNA-binding NtrC family response regulator
MMESRPKILIVDDERIVCDMTRYYFEHDGYHVTTFTDSTQALAALEEERFDVMIVDLKMKEVDGMQLLEFIHARSPQTKVIMLTAFATMETAVEAFRKHAFDFLTKPVRVEDLKATVIRALREKNGSGEENRDE